MDRPASLTPESVLEIDLRFRFQWEEAQQSYVLLYPEGMIKLNESAGEILKRCDGTRTYAAVLEDIKHDFPDADVEPDVREFLEIAHEQGWVRAKRHP